MSERGAPPKARLSFLAQSADFFALGHRADGRMSALISPLKSVINAFLYGQLVLLQNEKHTHSGVFLFCWIPCFNKR